jgi:hypothetical protein
MLKIPSLTIPGQADMFIGLLTDKNNKNFQIGGGDVTSVTLPPLGRVSPGSIVTINIFTANTVCTAFSIYHDSYSITLMMSVFIRAESIISSYIKK